MTRFKSLKVQAVKRELNERADALAKEAANGEYTKNEKLSIEKDVLEKLAEEVIPWGNMIDASDDQINEECWMRPIVDYLENSTLPKDKVRTRMIRLRAAWFTMIKGVMFKKSFSGPLLRCVSREEAKAVLQAIHSEVCGNHFGGRSLAHKKILFGYFVLT